MDSETTDLRQTLVQIVAWVVSVALLIVDLWGIVRATAAILMLLGARRQIIDAVWYGSLLILGCAGVACAIAADYYYRRATKTSILLGRVLKVVTVELAVGLVAYATSVLAVGALR